MKTLRQQTKDAALFVIVVGIVVSAASMLSGCGKDGMQGLAGTQGVQGPQGVVGAPGETCTVTAISVSSPAPNGGSLISCPDGSNSLVLNGTNGSNGTNGTNGTDGTNGADGSDGATGAPGAAGTPGTVVTSVQFCPGTNSYPSTFPEIGFCIDNSLYAVYSANDGFLTELSPGAYNSNAIGSSCNFTVGPNCQVSH